MNNKIYLTIGIPTFNGGKYIKDAMDSIINQINDIDITDIEILVSDNCSNDDTELIISNYIKMNDCKISYYKNNKDEGADNNINLVVDRSKGKYVWFLADDDLLIPGSLKHILKFIKNNLKAGIILNNWNDVNEQLDLISRQVQVKFENIEVFDHNKALMLSNLAFGFLSCIIVKRDLWNEVMHCDGANEFVGTGLHTMYTIPKIMLETSTLFQKNPAVLFRHFQKRYIKQIDYIKESRIKNFYLCNYILPKILTKLSKEGYNKQSINHYLFLNSKDMLINVLLTRLSNTKINQQYLIHLFKIFRLNPFYLLSRILNFLPQIIFIKFNKLRKIS